MPNKEVWHQTRIQAFMQDGFHAFMRSWGPGPKLLSLCSSFLVFSSFFLLLFFLCFVVFCSFPLCFFSFLFVSFFSLFFCSSLFIFFFFFVLLLFSLFLFFLTCLVLTAPGVCVLYVQSWNPWEFANIKNPPRALLEPSHLPEQIKTNQNKSNRNKSNQHKSNHDGFCTVRDTVML